MEEYSSEEVCSLCFPTVRREYSSFGVEDWRSSLLSVQRSSLFSERSREREGLFVFFFRSREEASKSLLYTLFSIEKQSYRLKKQREQASSSSSRIEKSSSLFLFLWSIYVIYTLSFSVLSTSSRERVIANLVVVFSLLTYIEYTLRRSSSLLTL